MKYNILITICTDMFYFVKMGKLKSLLDVNQLRFELQVSGFCQSGIRSDQWSAGQMPETCDTSQALKLVTHGTLALSTVIWFGHVLPSRYNME